MIINDMRDRILELSHVFQTHSIILAGDFNATLTAADSNNHVINKPNTVQSLCTLMEDHQLIDLGAQTGCLDLALWGLLWPLLPYRFNLDKHPYATGTF
jgi:hypothetical protein